jgi:hypothetical protein
VCTWRSRICSLRRWSRRAMATRMWWAGERSRTGSASKESARWSTGRAQGGCRIRSFKVRRRRRRRRSTLGVCLRIYSSQRRRVHGAQEAPRKQDARDHAVHRVSRLCQGARTTIGGDQGTEDGHGWRAQGRMFFVWKSQYTQTKRRKHEKTRTRTLPVATRTLSTLGLW